MLVGFVYLAVAPWIEIKVHSGQAKISLFVCWTILLPDKKCVKVISVQEAFVKGFAVHLSEFEISQTTWKNKTKNIKMLNILVENWKLSFIRFMWFARFQILICEENYQPSMLNRASFAVSPKMGATQMKIFNFCS